VKSEGSTPSKGGRLRRLRNLFSRSSPTAVNQAGVKPRIIDDPFVYQPLAPESREIRVLGLYPGSGDEIYVQLLHCSLEDSSLQYEALSYCWGDENDTVPVFMATSSSSSVGTLFPQGASNSDEAPAVICPFRIPRNCYDALVALRQKDEPLMLWVDAICIDQKNEVEKMGQIQLMQDIYRSAARVSVWLGKNFGYSPAGLDALEVLLDANMMPSMFSIQYSRGKNRLGMLGAFRLNWWWRTWIIQEIVLAKRARLVCGPRLIDWPQPEDIPTVFANVKKLTEDIWARKDEHDTGIEILLSILSAQMRLLQDSRPSLLELVEQFRDRQCKDPRDKVYAMLGLAAQEDVDLNIPDPKLTLSDVQVRLFRTCLPQIQRLDFLNCSDGSLDNPDVSSWAFTLASSEQGRADPIIRQIPRFGFQSANFQSSYFRRFKASGDSTPQASFDLDSNGRYILSLNGMVLDEILICGPSYNYNRDQNRYAIPLQYSPNDNMDPDIHACQHIMHTHRALIDSQYPEKADDILWRTIIADSNPSPEHLGEQPSESCINAAKSYFNDTNASPASLDTLDEDQTSFWFNALNKRASTALLNRLDENTSTSDCLTMMIAYFRNKNLADGVDSIHNFLFLYADGRCRKGIDLDIPIPGIERLPTFWSEFYDNPKRYEYVRLGFRRALLPRRFFVTNEGRLGLAPPATKEGDVVCVLMGGSTPYVLRKIGGDRYQFVGECFVFGLMDGEAMGMVERGLKVTERVVLY
jgi:hypothetical protein